MRGAAGITAHGADLLHAHEEWHRYVNTRVVGPQGHQGIDPTVIGGDDH